MAQFNLQKRGKNLQTTLLKNFNIWKSDGFQSIYTIDLVSKWGKEKGEW